MKITAILFSTLLILILLSTCFYDSEEYLFPKINNQCDTNGTVHFTTVDTVLQSNCLGCHDKSSKVNLDGYKYVYPYAKDFSKNPLIPILQGVIRRHSGFKPMPPDVVLDTCSIRKIEIWIEQGAIDN
jgi:hypothetical protein